MSDKLSYSHYCEIIWFDKAKINYYIKITEENNLSVRELRGRIKNKEYERLDDKTKEKLITKAEKKVEDFIKNPILIKNRFNTDNLSEKMLQHLIIDNMEDFLLELGNGFCFIKSEYKISIGYKYNYIDLLLFNYVYNCFIVIELKVTELKKEYIGQIETYMNYIDKNIKTINQNQTIGIIICRKDNKFVLEYCSDKRILSKEYKLI